MRKKLENPYNNWFVYQYGLNLESIPVSKFHIFIYINLDKAENYFYQGYDIKQISLTWQLRLAVANLFL